ncbi:MAG TPA: SDR family NAD(P)-dependent oxidoreductase [Bdellovibrionales bacterium]|nr:SDR family NAD(P)-dependent oxidoreductase [Bdellovibrionales bacterium]
MSERIAVFGASRGLGAAFVRECAAAHPGTEWLLLARKEKHLEALKAQVPGAALHVADFSKPEEQDRALVVLSEFAPTRVLYFAGGGPFRPFHESGWKDHRWALEVTFVFPARLLHWLLFQARVQAPATQAVFIGSAVAEDAADPNAASYAAAKHALRGLIRAVRAERHPVDVRLYSPGYLDTELLPANAWPRQQGLALSPKQVAQDLVTWIFSNDDIGFRIYK